MMPPYELLVESFLDRDEAVRAVDACSEEKWLKTWLLNVVFLAQPFAVQFEDQSEANELSDRIRRLGFQCKV
jgi:hypothetical protein